MSAISYQHSLKQKNQDFDQFLSGVLLSVRETDLTPNKRAQRRKLADADDAQFCRIYFPKIFSLPDNALHRYVDDLESGVHFISGFRESGKSARTYLGKAIKRLALGKGGIISINARTQDLAKRRCGSLLRIIHKNRLLQYDYEIKITKESEEYSIINSTHMVAGSVQVGLRNLLDDEFSRIDLALNDDLTDKQSGKRDKEKAVDFIEYEVKGQLKKDGLSISLFNDTEPDSPGVTFRELYPDNAFVFPALNDYGESNWPQYRSTRDWIDFQKTIPYIVWMGDFQCQPIRDGKNFDLDWLKFVQIKKNNIIASISACDPSHGQSPHACFKAVVTLGYVSPSEIDVLDIYLRKEPYTQMFNYVNANRKKWPHWKTLFFEDDFNQWALAQPYYQTWSQKNKSTIPIIRHSAKELKTKEFGSDKDSRILNLVMPHQTGIIVYNIDIKSNTDFDIYKSQFVGYGADKEKKDGLDAMATAWIMLPRWIEHGSFKTLKDRAFGGKSGFFRRLWR